MAFTRQSCVYTENHGEGQWHDQDEYGSISGSLFFELHDNPLPVLPPPVFDDPIIDTNETMPPYEPAEWGFSVWETADGLTVEWQSEPSYSYYLTLSSGERNLFSDYAGYPSIYGGNSADVSYWEYIDTGSLVGKFDKIDWYSGESVDYSNFIILPNFASDPFIINYEEHWSEDEQGEMNNFDGIHFSWPDPNSDIYPGYWNDPEFDPASAAFTEYMLKVTLKDSDQILWQEGNYTEDGQMEAFLSLSDLGLEGYEVLEGTMEIYEIWPEIQPPYHFQQITNSASFIIDLKEITGMRDPGLVPASLAGSKLIVTEVTIGVPSIPGEISESYFQRTVVLGDYDSVNGLGDATVDGAPATYTYIAENGIGHLTLSFTAHSSADVPDLRPGEAYLHNHKLEYEFEFEDLDYGIGTFIINELLYDAENSDSGEISFEII